GVVGGGPGPGPDRLDGGDDGRGLLLGGRGPVRPGALERDGHAVGHRGTFPCLRLGSSSRFDRSISKPAITLRRVSAGSITSSTMPRSAAMYGLVKRSVYSSTSSARRASGSAAVARSRR